ncbi:MAG: glutaredoxin family protein [Rhodoferax sp.]|nr:glutaredoxin family protein [Rhodoferax sp.]
MSIDSFSVATHAAGVALITLGCLTGAPAQTVYRGVAADGQVTFSDRPTSEASQPIPVRVSAPASAPQYANLPFALRQLVASYPVTLYSASDCAPCDKGRTLLADRGVPFIEKTVNRPEDVQLLKRLSQTGVLPLLTIGTQQLKGFSATEWQQFLGIAGYPEASQLPANYRNPPAEPLVALQAAAAPSPAASAKTATPAPPVAMPVAPRTSPSNPAGIQF